MHSIEFGTGTFRTRSVIFKGGSWHNVLYHEYVDNVYRGSIGKLLISSLALSHRLRGSTRMDSKSSPCMTAQSTLQCGNGRIRRLARQSSLLPPPLHLGQVRHRPLRHCWRHHTTTATPLACPSWSRASRAQRFTHTSCACPPGRGTRWRRGPAMAGARDRPSSPPASRVAANAANTSTRWASICSTGKRLGRSVGPPACLQTRCTHAHTITHIYIDR